MADILTFDPLSEYEVLETFDYEEEVQRGEELRFFTLDEQLVDYMNKVSGTKKLTRWETNKIKEIRDRYRKIYLETVTFTDEEGKYTVIPKRTSINVPWIQGIYSDFKYQPFSFTTEWMPIMDKSQVKTPNFYTNRLLLALPKPYKSIDSTGHRSPETNVLVNEKGEKGIKTLGRYTRTKGVVHEDGSFEVVPVPILNTEDDIHIKGYYIGERGVKIPNPLSNHPFLSSNEPHPLMTNELLVDVFPSMTAIMNHAVPTTTDPYVEGLKYLKVYDVNLKDIPWNLWKERFPPVDIISSTPKVQALNFPNKTDIIAPADVLQKSYIHKWYEGLAPRYWLSLQEDAGALVSKIWLSKVGDAGNVAPEAPGAKPETKFEKIYPDECLAYDNFDLFLQSGVYRSPTWSDVEKAIKFDTPLPKGTCITADYIQRERSLLVSVGRIPWRETAGTELLDNHIKLLKKFQTPIQKEKEEKFEKYNAIPDSELRRDIIVLLNDPQRNPEDKAEAIQTLINTFMPNDEQYFDKDQLFLICNHTLAILRGELELDRLKYYEKWATISDGFRVCRHCGQEINNDVLVAQDTFDSDGNPLINYDALDVVQTNDPNANISNIITSINELRNLFDLRDNAGETVLYLLISLLQILPSESYLVPLIKTIRQLTSALRSSKKVEKDKRERVEGILGIASAVILLQTHNPFLIPKSKFGVKNFKLSGYPRDTTDSEDSPILDNLIYLLKTVFEANPSTFTGPASPLLRQILTRPKEVRKETIRFLQGVFSVEYKTQLETAKERYQTPLEMDLFTNTVQFPLIHLKKTEYSPNERFGDEELMMKCQIPRPHVFLTSKLPPNVSHQPLELFKNIQASPYATFIEPIEIEMHKVKIAEKNVRDNLKLGLSKLVKTEKLEKFLNSSSVDGISIFTMLNRVLDLLPNLVKQDRIEYYRTKSIFIDTNMSSSLLRDTAKSIFYELFEELSKSSNKSAISKVLEEAIAKDITIIMLLFTKDQAENIVRSAQTAERETFKQRMRSMNDNEREITKLLLDIGLAPYIITNEDRETFAKELNYVNPEDEYNQLMATMDLNRPEEGYNDTRDYVENGDMPVGTNGQELGVDYGNYGDRAVDDYNDYEYPSGKIDVDEGYGI